MGLMASMGFSANPFEHYTAETEPHISEYAVRPPYLNAIIDRSVALNSFILFGERGSGKSATRITVFNYLWSEDIVEGGRKRPLSVNVSDFTQVLGKFQKGALTDRDLVSLVGFHVLEKILAWLSSLGDEDRQIYLEGLNKDERSLAIALLEALYLSVPEMDRHVSNGDALKLLNGAWVTKSQVWLSARWDALSKIFAATLATLMRRKIDEEMDIEEATEKLLKSLKSEVGSTPRAILAKLVDLARAFGFSGICVLIDKVDETASTANSAEATAKLIYPILNHIQLLEVEGFAWLFFLWSNVKDHFMGSVPVRLDKIAHANITWSQQGLREMVDARVKYFSDKKYLFSDILIDGSDAARIFQGLADLAMNSPREIIKVLDIIIREHDAQNLAGKIGEESINRGMDAYCRETVGSWYPEKMLHQMFRLGKVSFVNMDVQSKFKMGHQGARNRIIIWESSGAVAQDGTLPSELGGKQVHRYRIVDAKIHRIIDRKLDPIVGEDIEDDELGTD